MRTGDIFHLDMKLAKTLFKEIRWSLQLIRMVARKLNVCSVWTTQPIETTIDKAKEGG